MTPEEQYLATVHELQTIAQRAPRVTQKDVLEIASMPVEELRRRALVARDWHRLYQQCLDGLPLEQFGAAPDGCWEPRTIRRAVDRLLAIVNAPRGTDAQILKERELTATAINGAIAFGQQGVNPPPSDDHWLAPFWQLGRTYVAEGTYELGKRSTAAATASGHEFPDSTAAHRGDSRCEVANGGDARVASAGCAQPALGELAERLRKLATGRVEWRVQDPVERCYCISFDRSDCINPERDARAWLADFQRRYPRHAHAKYEAAEVRVFTELERAALEAADVLDEAWSAPLTGEQMRKLWNESGEPGNFTGDFIPLVRRIERALRVRVDAATFEDWLRREYPGGLGKGEEHIAQAAWTAARAAGEPAPARAQPITRLVAAALAVYDHRYQSGAPMLGIYDDLKGAADALGVALHTPGFCCPHAKLQGGACDRWCGDAACGVMQEVDRG
jgi:hypothetical protein